MYGERWTCPSHDFSNCLRRCLNLSTTKGIQSAVSKASMMLETSARRKTLEFVGAVYLLNKGGGGRIVPPLN